MPPVSITSVWPPPMIASGAANRIVFEAQSGVTVPGPHDLDADDEKREQQDQRIDRVARAGKREDRAHLRSCRKAKKPRDHHHQHDQRALDDLAVIRVDAEEDQDHRRKRQQQRGDDRADHSAAPAREADAADDDGGDAAQRVIGAGQRRADSGRHGQRHAADRAGDSAEAHRRSCALCITSTPLRNAATGSLPAA